MLKFYVKQFSFKQFFKKWPPYGSSKFKNRGEHQVVTGSTQDSDTVSYMMESELKKEIRVYYGLIHLPLTEGRLLIVLYNYKEFFVSHHNLIKLGDVAVLNIYYNFTKFH